MNIKHMKDTQSYSYKSNKIYPRLLKFTFHKSKKQKKKKKNYTV